MSKRRIYVASSWRNDKQPHVVELLRMAGHEVYDFKNPKPGNTGFSWSEIDPDWQNWTAKQYREALDHPIACQGYTFDMRAMEWADTCVLVLPCGRSAHLEAGWFAGRGKHTIILTQDGEEPELMALMCNHIVSSMSEVLECLGTPDEDLKAQEAAAPSSSEEADQRWQWWASDDEEHYSVGPCASKEEAIQSAMDEGLGFNYDTKESQTFHVVEALKGNPRLSELFEGPYWIEQLENGVLCDDYNDRAGHGPCDHIDGKEVEQVVKTALRIWEDRTGTRLRLYNFGKVRNGEWITKTFEAVDG